MLKRALIKGRTSPFEHLMDGQADNPQQKSVEGGLFRGQRKEIF